MRDFVTPRPASRLLPATQASAKKAPKAKAAPKAKKVRRVVRPATQAACGTRPGDSASDCAPTPLCTASLPLRAQAPKAKKAAAKK